MANRYKRKNVSHAIAGISYDKESKTLNVSFSKGGSHSYSDVPLSVANAFKRSSSQGTFFNENIRNSY